MVIKKIKSSLSSGLNRFFALESASGILLLIATALALIFNNSPLQEGYQGFLNLPVKITLGSFAFDSTLLTFVNDGLMTIFFLIVGLEIKKEFVNGEFSQRSQIVLPLVAAAGGMLVPALIYVFFNITSDTALHGWAIPSATDIAFSLTILSLLGSRVPRSLKVFLTALAIFDDLGAILIIAIFYHSSFSYLALLAVILFSILLLIFNLSGVKRVDIYLALGLLLWAAMLESGVHSTLAGVIIAMAIPVKAATEDANSPLDKLIGGLHHWVAFGIVPLFAFCNAGLNLHGISASSIVEPVSLGIISGLFFGKQIGVFGCSWLAIKSGVAKAPRDSTWIQIYGVSTLAGIGFTMSLFIGGLAFTDDLHDEQVKLGVLVGSLVSAILGYVILYLAGRKHTS